MQIKNRFDDGDDDAWKVKNDYASLYASLCMRFCLRLGRLHIRRKWISEQIRDIE